ncbi:hypothetical protein PQR64_35720 [Paraburkholderia phytofirmans]|uniref:hypothetical protein n=1 Tax=Paraburkholderia phytofirmans TaxID=261302 RepID=UPI0038B95CAA
MRKSQAEINEWIREQEARLGIGATETSTNGGSVPTATVYPSPVVIERLAHAGADLLIANNAAYASACERLDAELAEIHEGTAAACALTVGAIVAALEVRTTFFPFR